MSIPKNWTTEDDDKQILVYAKAGNRAFRVSIENDDVTEEEEKEVRHLASDIARLPRLLAIVEIIKEMFDGGQLDPYPSSDGSHEYRLRKLSGWKPKDDEE